MGPISNFKLQISNLEHSRRNIIPIQIVPACCRQGERNLKPEEVRSMAHRTECRAHSLKVKPQIKAVMPEWLGMDAVEHTERNDIYLGCFHFSVNFSMEENNA